MIVETRDPRIIVPLAWRDTPGDRKRVVSLLQQTLSNRERVCIARASTVTCCNFSVCCTSYRHLTAASRHTDTIRTALTHWLLHTYTRPVPITNIHMTSHQLYLLCSVLKIKEISRNFRQYPWIMLSLKSWMIY